MAKNWTNVNTRLPNKSDFLLVTTENENGERTTEFRTWDNIEKHFIRYNDKSGEWENDDKVIAWLPIPEPYKG